MSKFIWKLRFAVAFSRMMGCSVRSVWADARTALDGVEDRQDTSPEEWAEIEYGKYHFDSQ